MPGRRGAVHPIVAVEIRAEALIQVLPRCLGACLLAAALVGVPQSASAQDPYAPKWNPWIEFGGLGADDGDSRGVIEFWAPILQGPTALFFFDGKFQFIEDDAQEGNAQFGVRKMTPSGWNLGAWGSFDVRETSLDNTFRQVAGGLEALSVNWDLRVNGYLPVTDPQVSPSTAEIVLERNTIFMLGGQEVALHGVDGEVGYRLFGSSEEKPGTRHELRVYGGGFWFDHSDAIDEVAGPSTRLEWRIDDVLPDWGGSRLTFDTGYSHDEVRGDLWQVGGRLRIPLGGTKTYALLSPQARRMQERIERDDDIVTVKSGPEKVFDTLTGVRFDRVAHVNPSITQVSAEAGGNSLLIVNGTVSGPQELQGNQTLQGGQSTIQVTGVKSGVTKSFTAPGSTAHLVDPGNAANLTLLGSNTHVAGFDIKGAGAGNNLNRGIFAPDPLSNVVLDQLQISSTGNDGIFFINHNRDIIIEDVSIPNAGASGIAFLNGSSDILISGVRIANAGANGIFFGDFNSRVVISGAAISDTGKSGIVFDANNADFVITDAIIARTGDEGIRIVRDNRNVLVTNAVISQTGDQGIHVFDDNHNVTIAATSITQTGNDGIFFRDRNTNVSIAGVTIQQPGISGIAFLSNNSLTISDVAITGGTDNGIFLSNGNVATIADTIINNPAADGIRFQGDNIVTVGNAAIDNAGDDGISFDRDNVVTLSGTVINNAGNDGINFLSRNTVIVRDTEISNVGGMGTSLLGGTNIVTVNDTLLTGLFGANGIAFDSGGNKLNGAGNSAANAIFGDKLCDADGNAWSGSIEFDGVAITNANCP